MKILIRIKKSISIITALCLLISFVIGPTAANAMTNEEATKQYKQIFKDFMLPYSYGQITSAHYAGTDRVIINIQDLHCHPKVQKNISNIIETFDKSYGVKKIYLEGAYGQVDTSWLTKKVQDYNVPNLLDKMLETGRLTGAEYYSAASGKTEIISGLEEKEPYLENLKRFGSIIENQEKINLILNAMDESLMKLKQQYYTKRQYKLENLSNDYKEGTISPQKYYALLSKHVEKLGIDLTKYENTFTYIMLLEMQKSLDYSKITRELQNLVLLLKEQIPYNAYKLLLENTENFENVDKLYVYLVQISKAYNLDLSINFPNLDKYFGYIEFSQKINPLELITEEELLIQEINTRFSETKAQREVVFLTNFGRYLKDYVSSKITSSDYEYYKENIGEYRDLWNKYVDNRVLSLLDEYIAEADKFYKINTDRNVYFTRNMFGEEEELNKIETEVEAKGDVNKIIENMKGVKEVDVVVTGGFHSQTVTEILKNQGVSYIVITPNVTDGVKLAEETYYQIAREQSKISFQALANLISSLSIIDQIKLLKAAGVSENDLINVYGIKMVQQINENETAVEPILEFNKRELDLSKILESDDLGDIRTKMLELIKGMVSEELREDIAPEIIDKIKAENLKRLLENTEKLEKAIIILSEDNKVKQAAQLVIDFVGRVEDFSVTYKISKIVPKAVELSEQEMQRRKDLETEAKEVSSLTDEKPSVRGQMLMLPKTKKMAIKLASKIGIRSKFGINIIGSILAGWLEIPDIIGNSAENFVKKHSDYKDGDRRIPLVRALKIVSFVSVTAATGFFLGMLLSNPLNWMTIVPISLLKLFAIFTATLVLPHQIYDLSDALLQKKEQAKKEQAKAKEKEKFKQSLTKEQTDKIEKILDIFQQKGDKNEKWKKLEIECKGLSPTNIEQIQLGLLEEAENIKYGDTEFFIRFICRMPFLAERSIDINDEEKVEVSESVQEKILDKYSDGFLCFYIPHNISNLSKHAQQVIIDNSLSYFRIIEKPHEDIQIIAVERDWENIRYIKNPSERVKKAAINSRGFDSYAKDTSARYLAARYLGDFLPDGQKDNTILRNAIEGKTGKNISVSELSKYKNSDTVRELFAGYKKVELLNMEALKLLPELSDSSSKDDLDRIKKVLFEMIDILATTFPENTENLEEKMEEIKKLVDTFFNDIVDMSEQTVLHQKTFSIFNNESLKQGEVTINDLINVVHQETIKNFLNKLGKFQNAETEYYNFSKGNYINPEIRKILQNMFFPEVDKFVKTTDRSAGFALPETNLFFDEKTVLMNLKLGVHSATVIINLDNKNRGILVNFWDNGDERIKPISEYLKQQGFSVLPTQERSLLSAKMDITTGLTEETDIPSILQYLMFMFSDTLDINLALSDKETSQIEEVENRFKEKHLKGLYYSGRYYEDKAIDDKYDCPIMTREDPDFAIFDQMIRAGQYPYTVDRVNQILKDLGLPQLPLDEDIYYEEQETHVKVIGQVGLDKYFTGPVIRAFAEGRINGNLTKNENYRHTAGLENILNDIKRGNITELLTQATIIDELNKQNGQILKLKTEAKFVAETNESKVEQEGKMEYQTGYLQLSTGDYLFVEILKNSVDDMVRYASVELVSQAGKRSFLTTKELTDIIQNEGYKIYDKPRLKGDGEKEIYRKELEEMEKITENISTSGRLMGGQRPSVLGKVVFDSKNVEEGNILFKDFLSPDDIEGIIKAKGIVLTSGAELSHMGLQVKEKGKLATIIKGVRFIKSKEKDEKGKEEEKIIAAEIKYMEYTGTSQIVNGFKVKDVVEKTIIVREGDVLAIDGETGRLIIFEKDVVNGTSKDKAKVEEYKKYKSTTVSVVQEEKTEKQAKQKVEVERKQVWDMDYTESKDNIYSNFIKGFKNIADTIKKYFGTKATNLQDMSNIIKSIAEKLNIKAKVPDGKMIGYGVYLHIFEKIGVLEDFKVYYKAIIEYGEISNGEEESEKIDENKKKLEAIIQEKRKIILDNLDTISTQKELYNELLNELKNNLGINESKIYAVRSTFIGEDGKDFSSAGVGESIVGVKGDAVVDSLINVVLRSMFKERSVAYQLSTGQAFLPAALVQEAVDSEKSAVMLVRDNKIVISGSWGQGEIVVSGENCQSQIEIEFDKNIDLTNWDEKTILEYIKNNPKSINIVKYKTGRQNYKYGFNGEVKEVSDEDSTREIFSEEEIINLSKLGINLLKRYRELQGENYKKGADIELAIEKGVINVVQIRPITEKEEIAEETTQEKQRRKVEESTDTDLTLDTTKNVMEKLGIRNKTLKKIFAAVYEAFNIKYMIETRFDPLGFVKRHYTESQTLSYEALTNYVKDLDLLKKDLKRAIKEEIKGDLDTGGRYSPYVTDLQKKTEEIEKKIAEIEDEINKEYPGFLTRLQGARRIAAVTNAVSIVSFVSALFISINFFPLIISEFAISYTLSVLASILAVWLMGDLASGLTHAIYNIKTKGSVSGVTVSAITEFLTHSAYNFLGHRKIVMFSKNEYGNIYIIINKGENRYSLTFDHMNDSIYVSSINNDFFTKDTVKEEYKTIEGIEKFLNLKINISEHSIAVKSEDSNAIINIVKQQNTSKIVSRLKGKSIEVEKDEYGKEKPVDPEVRKYIDLLKNGLRTEDGKIEDRNIETVFLDEEEMSIVNKLEKLMNERENEDKLLVIYPFSHIYNTKNVRQLFSLYYQLNKNLREIFGLKSFPSFKGNNNIQISAIFILLEFVKNAIFHGNLADLSKPIYIKYSKEKGEDGFVVYNVSSKKTMEEEENLRLALATMVNLSGAHVGLKNIQKFVDEGFINMSQYNETKDGIPFYVIGAFHKKDKTKKLSEKYPENAEKPDYYHGTSMQSALQILKDGKLRTDVPMANGYHPAAIYMVEASHIPMMESKYSMNSGYDVARLYATNNQDVVNGVVLGFAGKTRHYKSVPKTLGFDIKELSLSGDEEGNVRLSELSFSSDEYLEKFIKDMLARNIKLPNNVTFRVKNNKVDKYISRNELEKIISDLESQEQASDVGTKLELQKQETKQQVEQIGQQEVSISLDELYKNYSCDLFVEQEDGSIVTISFSTMGKGHIFVSPVSRLLADGTILKEKRSDWTIEDIEKEFKIKIIIDTDDGQMITVENKGAKSISPMVNFSPMVSWGKIENDVIDQIKSREQTPVVEDENVKDIISDINKESLLRQCKGYENLRLGDIKDNPEKLINAIKDNKLLVIYPFYCDISKFSNIELHAAYCYISLLLRDFQIALMSNGYDEDFVTDLREAIKNAILHGNLLDPQKPIYIYCDKSKRTFSVYNTKNSADGKETQRRLFFGTRYNFLGGNHLFYLDMKGRKVKVDIQENLNIKGNSNEFYKISVEESSYEEEFEQDQKQESQETIKNSIKMNLNPMHIVSLLLSAFNTKINIKKDTILVETEQRINIEKELKGTNIDVIDYRIDRESSDITGGVRLGEINGRVIRAKKSGNTITFFSKAEEGLEDIDDSDIKDLFIESFLSGRKDLKIKEGSIIAFARESDRTIADIQNRLNNAKVNSIMPSVNLRYDLREKNSKNEYVRITKQVCDGIKASTGRNVFMITREQEERDSKAIASMEGEYIFIVVSETEQNLINDLQNDIIGKDRDFILDMTDKTMDLEQVKSLMERMRTAKLQSKNGVSETIVVKLNSKTSENLDNFDFYGTYGIMPLVPVENISSVGGKKEVYNLSSEENIEKLRGQNVSGFVIDRKLLGAKKWKKYGIRDFLANLSLVDKDTPEWRYRKGAIAAMTSPVKFEVINMEEIMKKERTEEKGFLLSTDLEDAKLKVEKINDTVLSWFNLETQLYIKHLIQNGHYEEALGFVRGVVMRTVAEEISTILDLKKEDFFKDIKENNIQAILIITIQKMMNGETVDDMYHQEMEGSDTVRAADLLDQIRFRLNKDMDDVLRKNEYKIEKVEPKAIADFNGIPEILMDSYGRKATVAEEVKISVLAVRSMLAAA